jgi:hypothetical protein
MGSRVRVIIADTEPGAHATKKNGIGSYYGVTERVWSTGPDSCAASCFFAAL